MRIRDTWERLWDILAALAGLCLLGLAGPLLLLGGWLSMGRVALERETLVGENRRRRRDATSHGHPDRRSVLFPGRPITGWRFTWPRSRFWQALPLTWNLLRGEVTLFGPRPLALQRFNRLKFLFPQDAQAPPIKPGLLGLAQLDDGRDSIPGIQRRKLKLDADYLRRSSPWLNLQILLFSLLDLLPGVHTES